MNTVAMDRNTLNGLFANQKKLDDLFDSIFDDENYFISSSSSSSQPSNRHSTYDDERQFSYNVSNVKDSFVVKKRNPFYYLCPIVLEISIIYLVVTNLL
jgi:hypothetical protein